MYINPFVAGVLTTILSEVLLFIVGVVICVYRKGRK